jgi:hypothetical protein
MDEAHRLAGLGQPAPQPHEQLNSDVAGALLELRKALTPNKKEHVQPTAFTLHGIRTWGFALEEAGMTGLELKLQSAIGIGSDQRRGGHAFDLLWAWTKTVFEQGTPEAISESQLALGNKLLRDCRIAAAGVGFAEVNRSLVKLDYGDDDVGRAIETASRGVSGGRGGRGRGRGGRGRGTAEFSCWTCGEKGHKSPDCPRKQAAPVVGSQPGKNGRGTTN